MQTLKTIKNIKLLFAIVISALSLSGCENMRDDNGDLGGMWQLTEWRSKADNTVITSDKTLYYSIQCNLMKLQLADSTSSEYYLATFSYAPTQLTIEKVYEVNAPDNQLALENPRLRSYGLPVDGKFDITYLSDEKLVLSTKEYALTFRKY